VIRHRLADARHEVGQYATHAELAEFLNVSEKTVRRWLKVAG
jgi:DeoR/GlpR family transcriptional regulator of sugar metabolism